MPPAIWDVDNSEHQTWIKDFFWRTTEELCEAAEYYYEAQENNVAPGKLFYEEISDALHFLIEPMVMLGYTAEDLENSFPHNGKLQMNIEGIMIFLKGSADKLKIEFPNAMGQVIYELGLAANCLKNKKWKQTQVLTDVTKFKNKLFFAFMEFLVLCCSLNMSHKDLYTIYMEKALVNEFRQETNY